MYAMGRPTQKIKIKIESNKGKSNCFGGSLGNTIGSTIRFITIQTNKP